MTPRPRRGPRRRFREVEAELRQVDRQGRRTRAIPFKVELDRGKSREEIFLSDAFNHVRNQVWLSVRKQVLAAEGENAR